MAKYRECPFCRCSLDFGERCDCQDEKQKKERAREEQFRKLFTVEKNGQLKIAV